MPPDAQFLRGPVPVTHALIAGDAVRTVVARAFGIAATGAVRLLQSGLNDHYLLPTHQGDHVVRVYRHGWRSDADVTWELALIAHLAQAGAPVAGCLRPRGDDWFRTLPAPEGRRQVAVFAWAPGPATHFGPSGTHRISPLHCAEPFGRSLAAIHAGADTFIPPTTRFVLDQAHLLDHPLAAITRAYPRRVDALRTLHDGAATLAQLLDAIGPRRLDWGPCHGDCSGGNSTYTAGTVVHFDFDCGGPGWRAYDLGVFFWSLTINGHGDEVWVPFLRGYRAVRAFGDADQAAVPLFAGMRVIWLLGLWCANGERFGHARLHDDYLDREVAHLQTFVALAQRNLW